MRQAVEKASCLPWDYPIPRLAWGDTYLRVCLNTMESNEITAFNNAMAEANTDLCDCLPDCEGIRYNLQVERKKFLPPQDLCKDKVLLVQPKI